MSLGMILLLTINPAVLYVKQDAWIAIMWPGVFGILIAYISTRLSLRYPGQTIIEYSQSILGKWLGRLITIPYLLTCYSYLAVILREFADFIQITLFEQTPLWVPMSIMVLALMYVTYKGGIEGIARCAEILAVIIILSMIIVSGLSIRDWDYHRLLPLYLHKGVTHIISGGLPATAFFGEPAIMVLTLFSFLKKPKTAVIPVLWACIIVATITVLVAIGVVAEFGSNVPSRMIYPVFMLVQYISILDFIQNTDVLIVIVWIVSIFVKLSIYLFITSYGTTQWLSFPKYWERMIGPVALITFIIAMIPRNTASTGVVFVNFAVHYVVPIVMIGIPILLLIVGLIRKQSVRC